MNIFFLLSMSTWLTATDVAFLVAAHEYVVDCIVLETTENNRVSTAF